ncbi:IclR family transcriptional regulator C-terminal domain-containing protein, partial [Saccharomonospora sp. NPDC046836]|uniref:IclR family transcriptional regulator domain-containing protein n=1 Tax=Saccharomonospora sp. NPDC046836 TaxID=3156921 RepID=UPI0033E4B5E5
MGHQAQQTGETTFVQRRVKDDSHAVLSVEPDRALVLSFREGNAMPLNRGAVAKVLLAFTPSQFRRDYVNRMSDDEDRRAAFVRDLETIRAEGFAESEAEVDEGIWGGAVPLRFDGSVIAALSIAGPVFRLDAEKRKVVRRLCQWPFFSPRGRPGVFPAGGHLDLPDDGQIIPR